MQEQVASLLGGLLDQQSQSAVRSQDRDSRRQRRSYAPNFLDYGDSLDDPNGPSMAAILLRNAKGEFLRNLMDQLEDAGNSNLAGAVPIMARTLKLDR